MKKLMFFALSLFVFFGLSFGTFAMDEPDLEGPIVKINTNKNEITVKNVGEHSRSKNKEKKVLVKQGMINNYKMHDYVQIRLMADNYEAKMIEKMATPKDSKAAN